ncbi:MAG: sensor domain-containing diguanylate cyclase [Burkholderiales bacterium]
MLILLGLWSGTAIAQAPVLTDLTTPAATMPTVLVDNSMGKVDVASASSYWIDDSGMLAIDEIETVNTNGAFNSTQPEKLRLTRGGALWVSFDVELKDASTGWYLQVALPGIDSVTLYHRNERGLWRMQRAGDSLPMNLWPQAGRYPVFALSNSDRVTRYYARIVHQRVPFYTPIEVVNQAYLAHELQEEQFLLGAYFGLIALVLVLASVNALIYRDRAFAMYVLYLLMLGGTVAAWSGVGAQYFWREQPAFSNASLFFLPLAASACALWLVRIVLVPRQYAKTLDLCLLALASLLVLAGLVDVLVPTLSGFAITNALVLMGVLLLTGTLVLAAKNDNRHVPWLALGFCPILLVTLEIVAKNFHWINLGSSSELLIMLASVWEVPVLFIGLNRRLAQRKESEVRARAALQTDPLTGLANRRVFMLRLERALLRAKRYQQPLGILVVDLFNHAALQKEFGRHATEQALVLAATRLLEVVRDVDTVARVGENEFALLIEGPCQADQLTQIATRALAQGLRPSGLLPAGATLRFHISMAIAPQNDRDEEELMAYLLADVGQISADDKKTIRTCAF